MTSDFCAPDLPKPSNLRVLHAERYPEPPYIVWGYTESQMRRYGIKCAEMSVAQTNDEMRAMQESLTEANSEIARLEEELSQTKKQLTDAECAWQSMDWWAERYQSWPEDIKRKLSVHDLRRMTGWRPPHQSDSAEKEEWRCKR